MCAVELSYHGEGFATGFSEKRDAGMGFLLIQGHVFVNDFVHPSYRNLILDVKPLISRHSWSQGYHEGLHILEKDNEYERAHTYRQTQ